VHNGRVVKRTGDGAIVEFRSVVDAVRLAIEVQHGTLVFDEDRDHVWEDAWKHRTEHL
jgi:class 3 adenylate cyclase